MRGPTAPAPRYGHGPYVYYHLTTRPRRPSWAAPCRAMCIGGSGDADTDRLRGSVGVHSEIKQHRQVLTLAVLSRLLGGKERTKRESRELFSS